MEFLKSTNIDFLSRRRFAYVISSALIVIGFVSLILHGGPNYGIDFKGGTSIIFRFHDPVTTADIREALTPAALGRSEIKTFGAENEYVIYVEQQEEASASDMVEKVEAAISTAFPEGRYDILQEETVGPKIGRELRGSAIKAMVFALLLILIYISMRFEFVFAVGAVAALFHDVLITLGIFSLFNFEVSLKEIAAFLTLIGYSLNDTIVVYDRIRENLKVMRSEELPNLINRSINQVLSRTAITSVTTFIVVLILYLFGGEVLKGFAFVMVVGVIVGTYSSIFVASPLIVEWQNRHGGKQQLRMAKKKR
ncbi:MAG TPA: protein translocase subunit SecF [bacterium]|nr:protein translocase subunit SecF [bacterium]